LVQSDQRIKQILGMPSTSTHYRREIFRNFTAKPVLTSALQSWANPQFEDNGAMERLYPATECARFHEAATAQLDSVCEAKMITPDVSHGSRGMRTDSGWKLILESVSPRKSIQTEIVYYSDGGEPVVRSAWENVRPAAEIMESCLQCEEDVAEALYEDPEGWSAASRRMLKPLYDLGYKDSRAGLVDPASGTLIIGTAKWKYQPTSPPSESGRSGPVILQILLPPSDQRLEPSQLCWEYDGELTVSEVRGQGDEGI
jgi:hypothetical protein